MYYFDGNNQVQEQPKQQYTHNPKFSPNLQQDLYKVQFGQAQQQQQQAPQQQQQPQQQQYQQYVVSSQYAVGNQQSGNQVNFNDGEYSPAAQQHQQYSPQSQQYVDNKIYVTPPPNVQKQQSFGPIFSPAVTGNYPFAQQPYKQQREQRPPYSLYSPNSLNPYQYYGSNQRPVYQSQQNYRPQNAAYENGNGGGLMDSISNFFTNIGQGAAELLSGRPPVNSYQPPVPITATTPNQQFISPDFNYNQRPGLPGIPGVLSPNGNPVNQFTKGKFSLFGVPGY